MEAKERGSGFCGNRRKFAQQRQRERKIEISKLRDRYKKQKMKLPPGWL